MDDEIMEERVQIETSRNLENEKGTNDNKS
jgi:hypothetical protein